MTFEKFDQSDEKTWHDQKKIDKDNDNDKDNSSDFFETPCTLVTECLQDLLLFDIKEPS